MITNDIFTQNKHATKMIVSRLFALSHTKSMSQVVVKPERPDPCLCTQFRIYIKNSPRILSHESRPRNIYFSTVVSLTTAVN